MFTLDQNLVRRRNSKIHDISCGHRPLSVRPVVGTKGMTLQEVIEKYGKDLCTHCFPAARVEKAQLTLNEEPEYHGTVTEEDGLLLATVSKHPGQYDPNALEVYAARNGEWFVTNPRSGTYRVSANLRSIVQDGEARGPRYADHSHVLLAARAGVEALDRYNEAKQTPNPDTNGVLAADDVVQVVDGLRDRGLIHGAVVGASPMTGETIAQVADVTGRTWVLETGPFGVWTDRDGTTPCGNVWGATLALTWFINADRELITAG